MVRGVGIFIMFVVSLTLPETPLALGAPRSPVTLTIGTNPPGTLFYAIGSGIARVLSDYAGVRAVVQPYSGSSTFLPLLNSGELQLGVVNAVDLAMAYRGPDRLKIGGRNPYQSSPHLRLVVRGGPIYVVEGVRRDSPFRTIADLRGRRVTGVYSAHFAVWLDQYALLTTCGLSWEDVQVVPVSTSNEGLDALLQGRAEAAPYALGSARSLEIHAAIGLRGLSACSDEPARRRLQERISGYYLALLRAGRSPEITQDTWVVAKDIYLVTHKDLPEEVAYRVTRTLWEQNRRLWPLHSSFEEWATRRYVDPGVTIPYHPGAIRLYREKGAWTPQMEQAQARLLQEVAR
ncbi:MAG: TAXI family TRAP transporter solute-binding subunit [Armatimonadota bacterium]|nr:TAXI family TRAP transporter solute-binding subunit [Armatimonadota bacterium]MDR7569502.1 TAXI family TRAP transporter solute-binding subunit [Armatimonadota bacterium]MDR7613534.1 TAXI family TRAP transporter solute-binding subunit [Armatimonadota bacterium]